jgi:hypothetical protein
MATGETGVAMLQRPLTSVLLVTLLLGGNGLTVMPAGHHGRHGLYIAAAQLAPRPATPEAGVEATRMTRGATGPVPLARQAMLHPDDGRTSSGQLIGVGGCHTAASRTDVVRTPVRTVHPVRVRSGEPMWPSLGSTTPSAGEAMTSNVAPGKDAGQHRAGGAPVLEGLVAIAPVVGTARVESAGGTILMP